MVEIHPKFNETLLANRTYFECREGQSNVDIGFEAHFRIMIVFVILYNNSYVWYLILDGFGI